MALVLQKSKLASLCVHKYTNDTDKLMSTQWPLLEKTTL